MRVAPRSRGGGIGRFVAIIRGCGAAPYPRLPSAIPHTRDRPEMQAQPLFGMPDLMKAHPFQNACGLICIRNHPKLRGRTRIGKVHLLGGGNSAPIGATAGGPKARWHLRKGSFLEDPATAGSQMVAGGKGPAHAGHATPGQGYKNPPIPRPRDRRGDLPCA